MPNPVDEGKRVPAQQEVASLLARLPDDCSPEDIQYHLYVLAKARNGLEGAGTEGVIEQDEAEARLSRWLIDPSDQTGGRVAHG